MEAADLTVTLSPDEELLPRGRDNVKSTKLQYCFLLFLLLLLLFSPSSLFPSTDDNDNARKKERSLAYLPSLHYARRRWPFSFLATGQTGTWDRKAGELLPQRPPEAARE